MGNCETISIASLPLVISGGNNPRLIDTIFAAFPKCSNASSYLIIFIYYKKLHNFNNNKFNNC